MGIHKHASNTRDSHSHNATIATDEDKTFLAEHFWCLESARVGHFKHSHFHYFKRLYLTMNCPHSRYSKYVGRATKHRNTWQTHVGQSPIEVSVSVLTALRIRPLWPIMHTTILQDCSTQVCSVHRQVVLACGVCFGALQLTRNILREQHIFGMRFVQATLIYMLWTKAAVELCVGDDKITLVPESLCRQRRAGGS